MGKWADIEALTSRYLVVADLIAGHISISSPEYRDFLELGHSSPHADLFLSAASVWKSGNAPLSSLELFSYYSDQVPLKLVYLGDGRRTLLFRSYLPEQADLDITTEQTRSLLRSYIQELASHGIAMLRVDALETLVKDSNLGYSSTERKVEIAQWLHAEIAACEMSTLAEVYVGQSDARRYQNLGLFTYNFGIVDHVFYALHYCTVEPLAVWLRNCSPKEFTFISNHDGFTVGLNELGLNRRMLLETRDWLLTNGGELTRLASGEGHKNISVHSVNGTLYEVVGRDESAWLFTQALVLLAPGIPILYYNDLLQGTNDADALTVTGEGRSLHRHDYSMDEITTALQLSGVQEILSLVQLRRSHSAFRGTCSWYCESTTQLLGIWHGTDGEVRAHFDIQSKKFTIEVTGT